MKDMQVHLEKLRQDAAECKLTSELATDKLKRQLFAKLAEHYLALAAGVERAITDQVRNGGAWNAEDKARDEA